MVKCLYKLMKRLTTLLSSVAILAIACTPSALAGGCADYQKPTPFNETDLSQVLADEMYEVWCLDQLDEVNKSPETAVAWLDKEEYDKLIFDSAKGQYVGSGPNQDVRWLIFFVDHRSPVSNQIKPQLAELAKLYEGKVRAGVVTTRIDEEISLAYDVTRWPRGFLIDIDGMAYGFNMWKPDLNETQQWINDKLYKESPLKFKAQPTLNKVKLIWAYVKKDVRAWYKANLRDKIEPHLLKYNITYFVDPLASSYQGIVLNQKTDRQILFLIAILSFIVESAYDLLVALLCPKKPSKKQGIIKKKKAEAKVAEEAKGSKREKIE